jgi:tagatose-6-phosphate ketose/aldose isomerase
VKTTLIHQPKTRGIQTHSEILQQPDLWPDTVERVRNCPFRAQLEHGPVFLTGAGTSAYAAAAIEAAWDFLHGNSARAIPSTDLLVDCSVLAQGGTLLSLARSGDSPESLGVIDRVQNSHPQVRHFAITCNPNGGLATRLGDSALILDPRTNDRSLVMTSSFSNLVLAGLCFNRLEALAGQVGRISAAVRQSLGEIEEIAEIVSRDDPDRAVVLTSRPLAGAAQEACLKILEMTAGRVVAIPETYLGLRHGPMSFLRSNSLVLCWLSNDPVRRRYEEDLLAELRAKKLGRIVCIGTPVAGSEIADVAIAASAPGLHDSLRAPFEIVFAQLLAYHMSLRAGLDPDSPSPDGVITRVVRGVRMHV